MPAPELPPSDISRFVTMQAVVAFSQLGLSFWDGQNVRWLVDESLFEHLESMPRLRQYVCETYAQACERKAFFIEHAYVTTRRDGREVYGYRLARLGGGPSGTGHLYSGETFPSWEALSRALRTLENVFRISQEDAIEGLGAKERTS